MDWLGIGVLIIGLAFLLLVIVLIKPLAKITVVLNSLQKTTDTLPRTLTTLTEQTTTIMRTSNKTIENVNEKVTEISPVFQLVGEIGEASRVVTAKALNKTEAFKQQTSDTKTLTQRKKYEGLYGLLSLLFILSKNKEPLNKATTKVDLK